MVERYNRSIAQIIKCCIGDRQERCDDFVGIVVRAISSTVNRSTGFIPNRMMLGIAVRAISSTVNRSTGFIPNRMMLGIAVRAISSTVNRSTGFIPNKMMLPLDLMLWSGGEEGGRGSTFRADSKDGWVEAHRKASEILEGVQRRQKKYYDLREENHNLRSRGCSIEEE